MSDVLTIKTSQSADFVDAAVTIRPPLPKMFGLAVEGLPDSVADLVHVNSNDVTLFGVSPSGDGVAGTFESGSISDVPLDVFGFSGGQSEPLFRVHTNRLHQDAFVVEANGDISFSRPNSIDTMSPAASLRVFLVDNPAGSATGGIEICADCGSDSYPCLRCEADGAEPMIGLLGAPAAPRQLLATGVGHTVDDVIQVLQKFGFCKQS